MRSTAKRLLKFTGTWEGNMLITDETTYREIAEYLYKDDPKGVTDLIYCIFELSPESMEEVLDWPICKLKSKVAEGG